MAYVPSNSSVVAFQSNASNLRTNVAGSVAAWIQSSDASVITIAGGNQSVSGTVGASIIGLTPVNVTNQVTVVSSLAGGIFPISGSVAATVTNTNLNVSGSVAAWLQSTNASVITVGSPVANQSVSGTVGASVIGHAPVVIVGGSILTSSTANQSVSGTVGASIVGTVPVVQSGTIIVSVVGSRSTSATLTSVLSSISTVSILTANPNRVAATIYNTSGTTVFTTLGTVAQTSIFTVAMFPNDYYEVPGGYTGVVAGITASNAGLISVTELT